MTEEKDDLTPVSGEGEEDGSFDDDALLANSDEEAEGEEESEDAGSETGEDIDYKARYESKAHMVESLKEDAYNDRIRRQEAERELAELKKTRQTERASALDKDIEQARTKYKRITTGDEDGDEIAAQEDLMRLIVRRERAEEATREKPKENGKGEKPEKTGQEDEPKIAPAARSWIDSNEWFAKGGKLADKAVEISAKLEKEGYDPTDEALYAELDKRLKPFRQRMNGRGRGGAAPVNRGGGRERPSGKTLTEADKRTMRTFGYDPRKPDHRKMWLQRNDPLD